MNEIDSGSDQVSSDPQLNTRLDQSETSACHSSQFEVIKDDYC